MGRLAASVCRPAAAASLALTALAVLLLDPKRLAPGAGPGAPAPGGRRSCLGLPGSGAAGLGGAERPGAARCAESCIRHPGCTAAVHSRREDRCHLTIGAAADPDAEQPRLRLDEDHSAWLCGAAASHEARRAALRALLGSPSSPPAAASPEAGGRGARCSWEGENCVGTRCCLDQVCPEDPQDGAPCKTHQCFQKNQTWASCRRLCYPGDWTCEPLGSVRPNLELAATGAKGARDASLFCVTAVAEAPYVNAGQLVDEQALLKVQQEHGSGIVGCDGSMTVTLGEEEGSPWSSYRNNVDALAAVWEAVRRDGRYREHSWIAKVDADAVFLPERLRVRLVKLAVPAGVAAYVENSHAVAWQLAGALAVLTREALDRYFLDAGRCLRRLPHQGREDRFLKLCLDSLGVQHTGDFGMLKDLREAPGPCTDPWAAAFHPLRAADQWTACLGEQQAAHASAWPPELPQTTAAPEPVTTTAPPPSPPPATDAPHPSLPTPAPQPESTTAAAPKAEEEEEDSYDCKSGLANWTKSWIVDKALWCCKHEGVGCIGNKTVSKPFDCEAGRRDFRRQWSLAKALWCCNHEGVGCFDVSK